MIGFRFVFSDDDDEGFELVEEAEIIPESDNDDDDEGESTQADDNEDEVIWEETED
jgi:hypothetical protein